MYVPSYKRPNYHLDNAFAHNLIAIYSGKCDYNYAYQSVAFLWDSIS